MSESNIPESPYVGLVPYSEEDALFFFGRDQKREIITSNLLGSRLTVLHGPSGVGKSSVLRAGVAYHLRQMAHQSLENGEKPEFVVAVFSSWRDDPVVGLGTRVRDSVAQLLGKQAVQQQTVSHDLCESLKTWTRFDPGSEHPDVDLLIILDQFEEYFLYHPKENGAGTLAFELPRAINSPGLRVNFLISIREDALAKLECFKGTIPQLFENRLSLEHLDVDSARESVIRPIDRYNELFQQGKKHFTIEPALVKAILDQVRTGQVVIGQSGRGAIDTPGNSGSQSTQIETPFLQMVMTRLWAEEIRVGSHVLRLETLNRLGGASHIVRTRLDATMEALTLKEQDAASRIFYHLVTPSGTKIAHTVPDLAAFANLSQNPIDPLLTGLLGKLGDKGRVLRPVDAPPNQPGVQRYEIFHDVLAPAILDWQSRYTQGKKAEQKVSKERQRRMRQAVFVLVALLFVMGGVTAFAFRQTSIANQERVEAYKQRSKAESQEKIATQALADVKEQKDIATNAAEAAQLARDDAENQRDEAKRQAQIAVQAKALAVTAQRNAESAKKKADEYSKLLEKSASMMSSNITGFNATKVGNLSLALESFTKAREQSAGNPGNEAYAVFNIAETHASRGRVMPLSGILPIEGSEEELNDPDVGSIERQRSYLSSSKSLDQKTFETAQEQAIKSYEEARGIFSTLGSEYRELGTLNLQRIGDVRLASGFLLRKPPDLDKAFSDYVRASSEYQTVKAFKREAVLLSRLGDLTLQKTAEANTASDPNRMGVILDETKKHYQGALSAYQRADYDPGHAAMLLKLGALFERFSKQLPDAIGEALNNYEGAAKVYGEMKRGEKEAQTYWTIASLCARSANKCLASDKYEQARKILQSTRSQSTEPIGRARLLLKESESVRLAAEPLKNDRQKLETYLENTAKLYERDLHGQTGVFGVIGDLYEPISVPRTLDYYERQRAANAEKGDKLGDGDIYLDLARVYKKNGTREKAIESLNLARTSYRAIPASVLEDKDNRVRADVVRKLMSIGSMYSSVGDKFGAFDAYEEAFRNLLAQGDRTLNATYSLSGLVQSVSEVLADLKTELALNPRPQLETRASSFFQGVFKYYESTYDATGGLPAAQDAAGRFYRDMGKRKEAVEHFELARLSFQRSSYLRIRQYDMLENIRNVYLTPPLEEAAARTYFECLQAEYQSAKDLRGEATVLAAVGSIYREAGKKEQAVLWYENARNAWKKANDRNAEAGVLRTLSRIYDELGQVDKALLASKEAINLLMSQVKKQ